MDTSAEVTCCVIALVCGQGWTSGMGSSLPYYFKYRGKMLDQIDMAEWLGPGEGVLTCTQLTR